jgi:hypothetical protein
MTRATPTRAPQTPHPKSETHPRATTWFPRPASPTLSVACASRLIPRATGEESGLCGQREIGGSPLLSTGAGNWKDLHERNEDVSKDHPGYCQPEAGFRFSARATGRAKTIRFDGDYYGYAHETPEATPGEFVLSELKKKTQEGYSGSDPLCLLDFSPSVQVLPRLTCPSARSSAPTGSARSAPHQPPLFRRRTSGRGC